VRLKVLWFLLVALAAVSALAQRNEPAQVSCTQFISWTAGGMSSERLDRLAHQRGLAKPAQYRSH